jgi:ubiquinone/menaquinone biosynthesis C-methylase UbiE
VFEIAADSYDRFMGRYSTLLAPLFLDFAGVEDGARVLDVGCGPGALTARLVERFGAGAVAAVDPSEPFVTAAQKRHPDVDVRRSPAEELPFDDGTFDAALAQLVVHFMADPVRGLAEMARVTAPGGVVAACVWDHLERSPLGLFWASVREVDPGAEDESSLAGVRKGHLAELLRDAGVADVEESELWVERVHETFEDWWEPFTLGVGPAGSYLAAVDENRRAQVREACRRRFGVGPATLRARAWAARGRAA